MDSERYLRCLAADEARLRQVADRDLAAAVPHCPEWSVRDLVEHVAMVYLHKVQCMRHGAPSEWPPAVAPAPTLIQLDRAYAELCEEFAKRLPESPSYTWYGPDQTVGFWHRRMAQETVIHRIDAELAVGEPVAPVPDDLALDGIAEVLERFLAYGSVAWREDMEEELGRLDGATVLVSAGGRGWLVGLAPSGVTVEPASGGGAAPGTADGRVSGDPQSVLLWLWRRVGDEAVTREGSERAIGQLRSIMNPVTQ